MALVLTAALCACVPFVGAYLLPAPSGYVHGGVVSLPAWHLLSLGVAFGPVVLCHSPFGEMEVATGKRWRRVEAAVLLGTAVVCLAMFTVICWTVFDGPTALLILRGTVGWMGLALVGGRIAGWRVAWVGPAAVWPVAMCWGHTETGCRWWEFTSLPAGDPGSWAVAGCLAAVGALAYLFSGWHRGRSSSRRAATRTCSSTVTSAPRSADYARSAAGVRPSALRPPG